MTFEILPEPLDGIEVGTVGRQENRDDVVLGEAFGLVPACAVENQQDELALACWNFGGHGIEEHVNDFRVCRVLAVRRRAAWRAAWRAAGLRWVGGSDVPCDDTSDG